MNMYTNTERHETKPQLCGKVMKNGQFRFWLFPADVEPSLTSAPHAAPFSTELLLTDVDVAMLSRMKQYNMRLAASTAARSHLSGEHHASSSLRNVSSLVLSALSTPDGGPQTELVDIICKVLSIDRRDPSMAVVHVWDGGDCPPLPPDFSHAPAAACAAADAARSAAAQAGLPPLPLCMLGCRRPLPLLFVHGGIAVVLPEELPELGTAVPLLLPAAVAMHVQQDVWGPCLGNVRGISKERQSGRGGQGETVRERQSGRGGQGKTVRERQSGRGGQGQAIRERRSGRGSQGEAVRERRSRERNRMERQSV